MIMALILAKFGENAIVDLTTFSVDGKHGKFRKPTNRVEKAEQFKLLDPPFSETPDAEMKAVSDVGLTAVRGRFYSLGFL